MNAYQRLLTNFHSFLASYTWDSCGLVKRVVGEPGG